MDIGKIKNASCIYISSLEYNGSYYEEDEKKGNTGGSVRFLRSREGYFDEGAS